MVQPINCRAMEGGQLRGRGASRYQLYVAPFDFRLKNLHHASWLQAADPYREHFATGEAWRLEHPEFEPKLCFYAFDTTVEHVEASLLNTALQVVPYCTQLW